jgi:hypothetical protein
LVVPGTIRAPAPRGLRQTRAITVSEGPRLKWLIVLVHHA